MSYSPFQKFIEKHGDPRKNNNKGMVTSNIPDPYEDTRKKKRAALDDLIKSINEANEMIQEVIPLLDSACGKYVQMLNELIDKKKKREQERGGFGPQFSTGKSKRKTVTEKDKNAKKMYNKIAQECHPDKTDDEEKHKLFMEAKDALEDGDDVKVFEIYSQFDDEFTIDDCINIDDEILTKTIEWSKIKTSNSYKICIIYKSGQQKVAKKVYLQGIMEQIQKLEMEEFDLE